MTWFPDMGRAAIAMAGDHIRAVGWLHPDHPYPRGTVPAEFLARLEEFARLAGQSTQALALPVAHGYHICEFCNDARGWLNFGVPDGDVLFTAPALVAHYVAEHTYAPPAEFVAAVIVAALPIFLRTPRCAKMNSHGWRVAMGRRPRLPGGLP